MKSKITLELLQDTTSPEMIILGEKLFSKKAVRELEEESPNKYVAFVDDGKDSYDIQLIFDKNNLLSHESDCACPYAFCKHKTAVFLTLINPSKEKITKTGKIKVQRKDKFELAVESVNIVELRKWVAGELKKNKELKLIFDNHFLQDEEIPEINDILTKTRDVVKTIAKSNKKLDKTQGKKIVEIWDKMHSPILDKYFANVNLDKDLQAYVKIASLSFEYYNYFKNAVDSLNKYSVKMAEKYCANFDKLDSPAQIKSAIDFLLKRFDEDFNSNYLFYSKSIELLLKTLITEDRIFLLLKAKEIYISNIKTKNYYFEMDSNTLIALWLEKYNILDDVYDQFLPNGSEQHNKLIFQKYLESENTTKIIKFGFKCHEISRNNSFYVKIVQYLILLQKPHPQVLDIIEMDFKNGLFIESYLYYMQNQSSDILKKTFRTKVLDHSKYSNPLIYTQIYLSENNFKKALESLSNISHGHYLIVQYFDDFLAVDKYEMLKKIIANRGSGTVEQEEFHNSKYSEQLIKALSLHFSEKELQKYSQEFKSYYSLNPVTDYYLKTLGNKQFS